MVRVGINMRFNNQHVEWFLLSSSEFYDILMKIEFSFPCIQNPCSFSFQLDVTLF